MKDQEQAIATTAEATREGSSTRRLPGAGHAPGPDSLGAALKDLNLGERLALARYQRGLTQKQLSELVGKSRATIIQYEQGRLQPPVQQIEVMAKALRVAPELIAFGRQGITGLPQSSAGVASLPEIQLDGEEEIVSGGYGFAESLVEQFAIERDVARVYILADPAPAFGLAEGDRVIVNPEPELSREGRLYALRAPGGVAVARLLPSLAAAADDVNLNGSYGETRSCKRSALTVLGVIVGMIRAS